MNWIDILFYRPKQEPAGNSKWSPYDIVYHSGRRPEDSDRMRADIQVHGVNECVLGAF